MKINKRGDNDMSIMKLALPVLCIIGVLGLCMASAEAAVAQIPEDPTEGSTNSLPSCSVTKETTIGDTVTLTGPNPPTGVTYYYLWTITDPSGSIVGIPASTAKTDFKVDSDPVKAQDYYVATLSVGAGTATSGQLTGCVLTSCVLIKVNKPSACALTGPTSICQTDTGSIFEYKGSLDAIKVKKVNYLKWLVDGATEKDKDYEGKCTVDWTKHWDSKASEGSQAHKVTVEVHSSKQDNQLSSCSMDVTVLPLPLTTITPT